ncbi:unnamed protein product, partial [Prorocentrum cordatum]
GYKNNAGCFMGDADTAIKFLVAFALPTHPPPPRAIEFNAAPATDTHASTIAGRGFTGASVDLSIRKYADDITISRLCHVAQ